MDRAIRAVIFDLDGTLADTAGEIHEALNATLVPFGREALTLQRVTALIGRGVRSLVERAMQQPDAATLDRAVEIFDAHYGGLVGTRATLFAGVLPGLERLRDAGLALAVATNKPRSFTMRLLERLAIDDFFMAVVAGDDGIARKPQGDMLVAACRKMGSAPGLTLMLGDSANDVLAARAAGCPVWCVPYGYNEGRAPEALECDLLVASVGEAAALIIGETK
jgi:phosphoglycolate phosphatase